MSDKRKVSQEKKVDLKSALDPLVKQLAQHEALFKKQDASRLALVKEVEALRVQKVKFEKVQEQFQQSIGQELKNENKKLENEKNKLFKSIEEEHLARISDLDNSMRPVDEELMKTNSSIDNIQTSLRTIQANIDDCTKKISFYEEVITVRSNPTDAFNKVVREVIALLPDEYKGQLNDFILKRVPADQEAKIVADRNTSARNSLRAILDAVQTDELVDVGYLLNALKKVNNLAQCLENTEPANDVIEKLKKDISDFENQATSLRSSEPALMGKRAELLAKIAEIKGEQDYLESGFRAKTRLYDSLHTVTEKETSVKYLDKMLPDVSKIIRTSALLEAKQEQLDRIESILENISMVNLNELGRFCKEKSIDLEEAKDYLSKTHKSISASLYISQPDPETIRRQQAAAPGSDVPYNDVHSGTHSDYVGEQPPVQARSQQQSARGDAPQSEPVVFGNSGSISPRGDVPSSRVPETPRLSEMEYENYENKAKAKPAPQPRTLEALSKKHGGRML